MIMCCVCVFILCKYNDVLLLWKLDHFNFPEYLTLSNSYLGGKYVILLCKHLLSNAYYFLYSGGEFILHYRFKIEVAFKEKIGNEVNISNDEQSNRNSLRSEMITCALNYYVIITSVSKAIMRIPLLQIPIIYCTPVTIQNLKKRLRH